MKRSERSPFHARPPLSCSRPSPRVPRNGPRSGRPPAVSVQRLAPQLVPFAGSEANFQSLVNGLATGTQVQLFTVLPNGFIQNVSFTPTAALTPTQVAQTLETARQQLIGLGIGTPTSEQRPHADGRTGADPARRHTGYRRLNPRRPHNLPSPAAQIQSGRGGATAPAAAPAGHRQVNVQTTPAHGRDHTARRRRCLAPIPATPDPAGATSRSGTGD